MPRPDEVRVAASISSSAANGANSVVFNLVNPAGPSFIRDCVKERPESPRECRESRGAGHGVALARACPSPVLSSLVAPATATASKRSVHFTGTPSNEFIASLWPLAEQRGVSRATFDRAFASVSFDPKVVAMTEAQPEFVRPIWDYVAGAVSADRIERGRKKADTASAWLTKAKQTYGVDEAVILGVWGLETDFGGFVGSNKVIRALATLAYIRFQGDYFRDELLSALVILEEGDIAPSLMRGSWAGAMGQTQFMPSSYLAYAVDFEGHGRRDIWTSEADAIGSTANYLAKHGWTTGLPWGFEVRLPSDFALSDADSSSPAPFSAFAARGVQRADGSPWPESGEGRLDDPRWAQGARVPRHEQLRRHKNIQQLNRLRSIRGFAGRCGEGGPRSRRTVADPRPSTQ